MPFFTPNNLASSSYVATMPPSSKDSALAWSQQLSTIQEGKLAEKNATLAAATQALEQAPTRQQVNAAKEKAADPTLSQAERDAAKAQAVALDNQRADALIAKGEAEAAAAKQAAVVAETNDGINNLKQAGAIENPAKQPSTNSAGEPVQAATPAQVLPTSNPAEPAVAVTPVVENAVPAAVTAVAETPVAAPVVENAAPAPITTIETAPAPNAVIQPQKQAEETDDQARLRITRENEAREDARIEAAAENNNTNTGISGAQFNTQTQATQQDISNFNNKEDWRVRLSLASGADYLYNSSEPGILGPLVATNGVIFPYTPAISVAYAAQYDPTTLTHTNYKFYTYNSSSVDQITLSCDFTAQDVFEANYLLAVIHFFRSVTKMFYGQDPGPVPGTPPPLCYLTGLGAFQFDNHPLAITNFTYSLPTEVDYIRAGSTQEQPKSGATSSRSKSRIQNAGLQAGATVAPPQFSGAYRVQEPTYVPTKIQISITAVPIVTRNDVSNNFSLRDYATGRLLRGSQLPSGGGFW